MNSLCLGCAIGILVLGGVAASPAQAPSAGPAFEVASMKVAASSDPRGFRNEGGPGTASPGQWTCTTVPLDALVMWAWNLTGFQFSRPSSMSDARYDILAKVPPGATRADFNLMIQHLLMERVGLALRQEHKEEKVQELVVAKGGIKMKPAEPAPTSATAVGPRLSWDNGIPQLPPGFPMMIHLATVEGVFFVGRMQGVDDLVKALQGPVHQAIIDKTGLTGKYDYTLKFALPVPIGPEADAAPGATVPEASSPGLSLESAIVEQLGLQLRPAKAMVDVLVVDHFNKTPAEN